LALVPAGLIRSFNVLGDYSYGLYILCVPIQQTFVTLDPSFTPPLLACRLPGGARFRHAVVASCRASSVETQSLGERIFARSFAQGPAETIVAAIEGRGNRGLKRGAFRVPFRDRRTCNRRI
jgi:hypothetical protein